MSHDVTEYAGRRDEYRARYEAKRERGECARHGCTASTGGRSLCERHAELNRANWRKRWGVARKAAIALAVAFYALASTATAAEPAQPAITQPGAEQCVCAVPANGARDGEPLDARAERLRVALRLTVAEQAVNRKRGKR